MASPSGGPYHHALSNLDHDRHTSYVPTKAKPRRILFPSNGGVGEEMTFIALPPVPAPDGYVWGTDADRVMSEPGSNYFTVVAESAGTYKIGVQCAYKDANGDYELSDVMEVNKTVS